MPGLSAWAVRRPVAALIAWFCAAAAVIGLGAGFGGALNDSFDLPDTESTSAMELLSQTGMGGGLDGGATIVWSPDAGSAVAPGVMGQVSPVLEGVATLPSVACVTNPTGASFGRDCPAPAAAPSAEDVSKMPQEVQQAMQAAAAAMSTVSADGRVAYATVTFAEGAQAVDRADAKAILETVQGLNGPGLAVGASGTALEAAGQEPPSSEAVGLAVAIIILLIAFGSIVAAGMPIVVALVGLAMGQMAVLMVARFLDVATFAPTLAAMIGLGVGIDYALFVMNRYRQALLAGHEPKAAATEAVETAGRAVLFAGSTVIIALLGLFVLRINFFNGLSLAASVTVLMVMLSAVWMLPALLSLLGTRALALRLPWGRRAGSLSKRPEGRAWAHYGRVLQRRPWLPVALAFGFVAILAIPTFSLRQGFADDSGKPAGSAARIAYDLRSEGFGAGVNGPFIVAVKLPKQGDVAAYSAIITGLAATEGVASTQPSVDMLPLVAADPASFGLDGDIAAIGVIPTTAPQDEATTALLDRLRSQVNPSLEQATGGAIYVGGTQAITSDFTTVLTDALPIFLAVVIGLGFLALVLLFRSIVVPLTAAVTSLLSLAAALGITVAVFQWGWLAGPLGVPGTGPIFPFLPIMVFAILFGLSMDYQVFLVSRMQEEWARSRDNAASVRRGLAGSGRVIIIAAAIMSSVFLAFVPSTNPMVKLFGIALASAVLIDAFIVRLVLVPALMSMLGSANWWLPRWLDRILPSVRIEPGEDEITDDDSDPRLQPAVV
ncbi:MAG: MMPL family transporter [Actinomycetales bacterium]|nr:MMPL family transporter [Actinomycetales bacterium]